MGNGNRERVRGRGGPPRQRNHLRRGQGPNEQGPGGGAGHAIRPVAEANACRGSRRPQHEVCGRDPDRCGSGRPPGPETSPGRSADRRLRSERRWPGREAG